MRIFETVSLEDEVTLVHSVFISMSESCDLIVGSAAVSDGPAECTTFGAASNSKVMFCM